MRSVRRYPRTARLNELIREVLADELERIGGPEFGFVTLTGVSISPDLRHGTVYYSVLEQPAAAGPTKKKTEGIESDESAVVVTQQERTASALNEAKGQLRSVVGKQVRMKYLPQFHFEVDASVAEGEKIESLLREMHERDQELGIAGPDPDLELKYKGDLTL